MKWTLVVGLLGVMFLALPLVSLTTTRSTVAYAAENADLLDINTATAEQLKALHDCEMYISYSSRQASPLKPENTDIKIQKVINGMAVKMRTQNQRGCNYIEAINEFIATGTN